VTPKIFESGWKILNFRGYAAKNAKDAIARMSTPPPESGPTYPKKLNPKKAKRV
jgi:hypothetical protein